MPQSPFGMTGIWVDWITVLLFISSLYLQNFKRSGELENGDVNDTCCHPGRRDGYKKMDSREWEKARWALISIEKDVDTEMKADDNISGDHIVLEFQKLSTLLLQIEL